MLGCRALVVLAAALKARGFRDCAEATLSDPDAFWCHEGGKVTRVAGPRECSNDSKQLCGHMLGCVPGPHEACIRATVAGFPDWKEYANEIVLKTCECLSVQGRRVRDKAGVLQCEAPGGGQIAPPQLGEHRVNNTLTLTPPTVCADTVCHKPHNLYMSELTRRQWSLPECTDWLEVCSGVQRYTYLMSAEDPLTVVDYTGAQCTEADKLNSVGSYRRGIWCARCNPNIPLDPRAPVPPEYACAKDHGRTCTAEAAAECRADGGEVCTGLAEEVRDLHVDTPRDELDRVASAWDLCLACRSGAGPDDACCVNEAAGVATVAPVAEECRLGYIPCSKASCAPTGACKTAYDTNGLAEKQRAVAQAACDCLGERFKVVQRRGVYSCNAVGPAGLSADPWDTQAAATFPYATCMELQRCRAAATQAELAYDMALGQVPECQEYTQGCREPQVILAAHDCGQATVEGITDRNGNVCSATQAYRICWSALHARACEGCGATPSDADKCANQTHCDPQGRFECMVSGAAYCPDLFEPPEPTAPELCAECGAMILGSAGTPGTCCVNTETSLWHVASVCPPGLPGAMSCPDVSCTHSAACNATLADPEEPVTAAAFEKLNADACECLASCGLEGWATGTDGVCRHSTSAAPFSAPAKDPSGTWLYQNMRCADVKKCLAKAQIDSAQVTFEAFAAPVCAGSAQCESAKVRQDEFECQRADIWASDGRCDDSTRAALCGAGTLAVECRACNLPFSEVSDPDRGACVTPSDGSCKMGLSYDECAGRGGYYCPDLNVYAGVPAPRDVQRAFAVSEGDDASMPTGEMVLHVFLSCLWVVCVLMMLVIACSCNPQRGHPARPAETQEDAEHYMQF